jgi:hypothetical protein
MISMVTTRGVVAEDQILRRISGGSLGKSVNMVWDVSLIDLTRFNHRIFFIEPDQLESELWCRFKKAARDA